MKSQKKSQFYLFTALLLIGIVLSYFSIPFILDQSQINTNEDSLINIYKEGQKAYNIGFSNNDFLKDYEDLYSEKNSNEIFYNLESIRQTSSLGENKLIFGNKGIENLFRFTSEAEAYQLSKNKKTEIIWFVKKGYFIGTKKFNSYYIIANHDIEKNNDLEGTNFRLVDSNSNIFYFYDSTNVENDKFIESSNLEGEQIDVYTICFEGKKCITQYEQEQNSLGILKGNNVQINRLNLETEELRFPIKIYYNNNEYILGSSQSQSEELSSLFGMIGISSDYSGNNIASVVLYS